MSCNRRTHHLNIVACLIMVTCYVGAQDGRNCNVADKTGLPNDVCTFDLKMKGAFPAKPDQYFCSGYKVSSEILGEQDSNEEGYVVRYEAIADANTAHHILVFGCARLRRRPDEVWNCGQVCDGDDQIIFAWAKNAPPLTLPKDVGQHIGGRSTDINYIVIQIHYAKPLTEPDFSGIRIYTTQQRQPFISGIYLLLNFGITIPANTSKFHVDSSCRFDWVDSIVPFGFRTHAHSLSQVISGYKVNPQTGQYELIGKGNPQWPQAFYPVEGSLTISPGDIVAARCTYNSTGRFRDTQIGSTASDEMCNFYIMYYMNSSMEARKGSDTCFSNSQSQVFQNIPADSDTLLPSNPDLESVAMGHHHHGMGGDGTTDRPQTPTERPSVDFHGNKPVHTDKNASLPQLHSELGLQFVSEVANLQIGQVGGLAVSSQGDLYIFHRGSNIWTALSFNAFNVYQYQNLPVDVDAIIVLGKDGALKRHFGKNRFYLPHGLSLDSQDNIWLTDVAMHQVFRIPKGAEVPDMTLGILFEPGKDRQHFCKPSDVAVLSSGEFFVSDGYCNSRVVKFDKNGYFIKEWGSASSSFGSDGFPPPGTFSLPHGLALAEEKKLLCVADRENGRIQCFDLDGNFVRQMHPKLFGHSLFALEYCPNHGGLLFAVNGAVFGPDSPATQGFTLDINTGELLAVWNRPGEGLTNPHDVTVDSKDHVIYVGELNPSKVWKFEMSKALYSTNSSSEGIKTSTQQPKAASSSKVTNGMALIASTISVVMETRNQTVSSNIVSPSSTVIKSHPLLVQNTESSPETSSDNDPVNNLDLFNTGDRLPSNQGHVNDLDLLTGDSDSTATINTEIDVGIVNIDAGADTVTGKKDEEDSDSFGPSVIIGTLLVVPILLLIVITVVMRLYQSGRFKNCGKRAGKKSVFSLGNFLHSHKGFDRLSTEDDDHDLENVLDDSDNEEFNITRKA